MVKKIKKKIRRIDVQDMGFVLNPDFPGAIDTMASFPYSTYDASGMSIPDNMPVVLSFAV